PVHRANHAARENEPFASSHDGTARCGVWLSELLQPAASKLIVPISAPARKRRRVRRKSRKEELESTLAPDPLATPPTHPPRPAPPAARPTPAGRSPRPPRPRRR